MPSGKVYITDTMNNSHPGKVTSGVITTVVGNGTPGYSGDGGPALKGQLDDPQGGLAVDSAGNLYVADTFNGRIREASERSHHDGSRQRALWIFWRWKLAAGAMLNGPVGVAVDSRGNLYIADTGYPFDGIGRIRKVSNGIITTVAGAGLLLPRRAISATTVRQPRRRCHSPRAPAVDAAGSIYIADAGGPNPETGGGYYALRAQGSRNGVITTIGGNGTAGFSGDFGPGSAAALNAFRRASLWMRWGNVYVADSGNRSLTSDGGNAFHLMDTGNNRIRLLSPQPRAHHFDRRRSSHRWFCRISNSARLVDFDLRQLTLANGTYLWNGDFPDVVREARVWPSMGSRPICGFRVLTQINAQATGRCGNGAGYRGGHDAVWNGLARMLTLAPYGPAFSLLGDGKHVAAEIISYKRNRAYDFGYYGADSGPANTFSFCDASGLPGEMLSLFGVGF